MSTGCYKPGCLSRFKTVTFTLELAVRVVISALASYRIARMVALETGPFALFSRFRGWVNIEQARKHGPKETWVTEGFSCPLCVGVYVSALILGLSYVDYVNFAVLWLAVAGLQTALQKQENEQ
jgi:hypothetical protein